MVVAKNMGTLDFLKPKQQILLNLIILQKSYRIYKNGGFPSSATKFKNSYAKVWKLNRKLQKF